MIGTVVVGAVGGQNRQTEGVMVGTHEMIRGRLARRIGAVRFVLLSLGEGTIRWGKRPVDLVGGNVEESETRFRTVIQSAPVSTRRLQEVKRADNIGLNEFRGAMDRAVHM